MKIALCLHGLFNSSQDKLSLGTDGYDYIKNNILNKGDVDVFVHSWETANRELITTLYTPKKSIFEEQKDFSSFIVERGLDKIDRCPRPPQSVLSHLYSVTEVMKLMFTTDEKYDIVIKARFDLGRINRLTSGPGRGNPYPVQCINLQTDIKQDVLYMANWNHFNMGPADMWFYGTPDIMKHFTTLYDSLCSQMYLDSEFYHFAKSIEGNPGDVSNSIAFYKWWMISNGLWDKRVTLDTVWE